MCVPVNPFVCLHGCKRRAGGREVRWAGTTILIRVLDIGIELAFVEINLT